MAREIKIPPLQFVKTFKLLADTNAGRAMGPYQEIFKKKALELMDTHSATMEFLEKAYFDRGSSWSRLIYPDEISCIGDDYCSISRDKFFGLYYGPPITILDAATVKNIIAIKTELDRLHNIGDDASKLWEAVFTHYKYTHIVASVFPELKTPHILGEQSYSKNVSKLKPKSSWRFDGHNPDIFSIMLCEYNILKGEQSA